LEIGDRPPRSIGAPAAKIEYHARFGEKSGKLTIMEKVFQAVYKDGVLRPDEPLSLDEMQRVNVVIMDSLATDDDLAGYFSPEEWAAAALDPISWDDVKRALSGISGSLSEAVIAHRQER
jgi:predicted DNA-binding antitoxin AbrB/MazE fold protein